MCNVFYTMATHNLWHSRQVMLCHRQSSISVLDLFLLLGQILFIQCILLVFTFILPSSY